jgi:hypothetical protein
MRPNRKKRELANWIRRRLGSPLVDVLIDTTQLDDAIDFAVDYFGTHAGGIGNEKDIIIICPEQVKYDATGKPCQPKPKKGRWRTYVNPDTCVDSLTIPTTSSPTTSSPTTGCQPPLDCSTINPYNTTDPCVRYGGDDNNYSTTFNGEPDVQCLSFVTDPCCPQETLPGNGWCEDNIQTPHCFTETGQYDENAIGPFWVEGDTSVPPILNGGTGFVFKTIYDVPSDVIGITRALPRGTAGGYFGGVEGFSDSGEALFSPIHMFLNNGGLGLGTGGRFGGGFVDLVGLELGLQYIEMFKTMYTVQLEAQLLELQHKVRISPAPRSQGVIALECYRKVAPEYMYEHIWVREYAEALCMIQIGINGNKYSGASFPGGASINAQFYYDQGMAKRDKLEEQITNGMYAEPPTFFWG